MLEGRVVDRMGTGRVANPGTDQGGRVWWGVGRDLGRSATDSSTIDSGASSPTSGITAAIESRASRSGALGRRWTRSSPGSSGRSRLGLGSFGSSGATGWRPVAGPNDALLRASEPPAALLFTAAWIRSRSLRVAARSLAAGSVSTRESTGFRSGRVARRNLGLGVNGNVPAPPGPSVTCRANLRPRREPTSWPRPEALRRKRPAHRRRRIHPVVAEVELELVAFDSLGFHLRRSTTNRGPRPR